MAEFQKKKILFYGGAAGAAVSFLSLSLSLPLVAFLFVNTFFFYNTR
jgi:hypothetical protein